MSGILTPKNGGLNARFDGERRCWLITVPHGLNLKAMKAAIAYLRAEKVRQRSALSPLRNSDQCYMLDESIKAIDEGRVHQVILTKNGGELFASHAKVNPHRTIGV